MTLRGMGYACLSGLLMATAGLVTAPLAASAQSISEASEILTAQQINTCRRSAEQIGIYQEPNTTSTAVGIVTENGYIRIGSGSGNGWIRVTAPEVGWVESRYLLGNDSTPCPAEFREIPTETVPTETEPAQPPIVTTEQPTPPDNTDPVPPQSTPGEGEEVTTRTADCRVTPPEGLVVRSRPIIIATTYVGTIPTGIQTIEFTNRTLTTETTDGTRQWVYILSPIEGWISPGFLGSTLNLVGEDC